MLPKLSSDPSPFNGRMYQYYTAERRRLVWVNRRNRIYSIMKALGLLGGHGTKCPNAVMNMFWKFPKDVSALHNNHSR